MKKILVYICLAIFSLQVLPLKEISKALFKVQLTEEADSNCPYSQDDDLTKLKKKDDPFHHNEHERSVALIALLTQKINTALHKSDYLPQGYTAEILSPPPDLL